ncbi:hypothetical protein QBC37DRAFT_188933 [Rhypophila decipiens]|uniref:Uncharacterized protein n=1 Tax=Rhypophila decipiens TaxID=261697 RepID=A0AAN7BCB5_9PEZI|nr:hypothetical protein QBC37DRAFT_188933 [Rhypophila decipiens]
MFAPTLLICLVDLSSVSDRHAYSINPPSEDVSETSGRIFDCGTPERKYTQYTSLSPPVSLLETNPLSAKILSCKQSYGVHFCPTHSCFLYHGCQSHLGPDDLASDTSPQRVLVWRAQDGAGGSDPRWAASDHPFSGHTS